MRYIYIYFFIVYLCAYLKKEHAIKYVANPVKNPQFLSLKLWVDTPIGFDSRHLGAVENKNRVTVTVVLKI